MAEHSPTASAAVGRSRRCGRASGVPARFGAAIALIGLGSVGGDLDLKGANIRVAAPLGEGREYRQHGFLVSLPCRSRVARRACS